MKGSQWWRSGVVLVGLATVTGLGVIAMLSPPRMLTFGMLALGPAFALASAKPKAVLVVGGYAVGASFAISTWQGLLGSTDQLGRLAVVAATAAVSWAIARHLAGLLCAA